MRVFIGLTLPARAADACDALARCLRPLVPARYGLQENYHITLAFIGCVGPECLPALQSLLRETALRFAPPLLSLDGPGFFPQKRQAILYCGVQSAPPLDAVHAFLIRQITALGLPCDCGPFQPHITLARKAAFPCAHPLPSPDRVSFTPPSLTLFESARDSENVLRYTPILEERWPAR